MATSAKTLTTIIEMLSKNYNFDCENAIDFLTKEELLPKKMITKVNTGVIGWASKKAEECATLHNIVAEGNGSGKNGKWTLTDVHKAMGKPISAKFIISPTALLLANANNISLIGKTGTGKDGRINIKDVQKWIVEVKESEESEESEEEDESEKNEDLTEVE